MDIEKIEAIAHAEMATRQYLGFREPGWILHHGKRTGKIALHLAGLINSSVDLDALYVSGLFHDIGKGHDRHNEVGAERTRELLSGLIAEETLDAICEAVCLHNQRKKADDLSESVKLIQDADLVDHVGFIDVWMSFYWSVSHGESIHDHLAWFKGDDGKRFREYMRTHLNFDVSREILEDRIQSSDQFFSDFHRTYFKGI